VSAANVDVVRAMQEAFAHGDHETATNALRSLREFDMRESGMPDAALYVGREEALEYLRSWIGTWEDYDFLPCDYVAAGDSVMVAFREHGRGKGSGVEMEGEYFGVYDLEDGEIVRFRGYPSREEALAAAGA
jgi:ketosteroid isomerase-like protein